MNKVGIPANIPLTVALQSLIQELGLRNRTLHMTISKSVFCYFTLHLAYNEHYAVFRERLYEAM